MRKFVALIALFAIACPAFAQTEALDEVNAIRAQRGLPPFQKDEGLTKAALAASLDRAVNNNAGHTSNDFAFLPAGCDADAAGCAAWPVHLGWGACCTYENHTHAGAAFCERNGIRFMHLFVRGGVGEVTRTRIHETPRRTRVHIFSRRR